MSKSPARVLLTTAHIRQWEAERARLTDEIDQLVDQRDKLDMKLGAAREIMEALEPEDIESAERVARKQRAPSRRKRDKATWLTEIARVAANSPAGMSYTTLKADILNGPLADRLRASDKGLYGAVAKMVEAKTLVKHGSVFFTPALLRDYEARVSAGEIVDVDLNLPSPRPSPLADAILAFIDAHPHGARSGDIVEDMMRYPQFQASVSRNRTSVYNVVKRLVDRNQVRKIGDKYYPRIRNEPLRELPKAAHTQAA